MKLVHYDFENKFFLNNYINVLVIENGKYFRQYSEELISQIHGNEGKFVLSDNDNILSLSSNTVCIYDFFSFDFSNKKLTNKLYSDLSNIVLDNLNEEYTSLLESFDRLFQRLNAEYDLPLVSDETSISAILKTFGVHFESDAGFLENLIAYIEILRNLNKIKLFCFINLKCFLSEDELLLLYDYAIKSEVKLFLLENKTISKLDNEKITLLDCDLCEIVIE